MATTALERLYKITVDGSKAIADLEKIAKSTKSVDDRVKQFSKEFSDLKRNLLGGIGFAAVVAGFNSIVASMSDIVDQSQKLGITTTAFQQLQFAAKQSGVSAEALNTGIKKLQIGLQSLNDPTSEQGRLLKELGVTAGDDVTKAFDKIADAYKNSNEEGKKVAIVTKALGKSANELVPLLNNGSEGLREFNAEMKRLGLVVDDRTLKLFDEVGDNFDKIGAIGKSVGIQLSAGLLPSLIAIQEAISDAAGTSDIFTDAGRSIGVVVRGLTIGFIYFGTVLKQVGTGIGAVAAATEALFSEGTLKERIERASGVLQAFGKEFDEMSAAADKAVRQVNERTEEIAANGLPKATRGQNALGVSTEAANKELERQAKILANLRFEYGTLIGSLNETQKLNLRIKLGLVEYTAEQLKLARAIAAFKDRTEADKKAAESLKKLTEETGKLFTEQEKQIEQYDKLLQSLDPAIKKNDEYAAGLEIITNEYLLGRRSIEELSKAVELLDKKYDGSVEAAKALNEENAKIFDAQQKQIDEYDKLVESLDPAIKKNEEYAAGLEIISNAYLHGRITAEELDKQLEKLHKKFGETNPVLDIVSSNFESFFKNLESGAQRADELFKRMVQSILAQLLRLAAQKAILAAFGINIGAKAAKGMVFAHGEIVRRYAQGGVVEHGHHVQKFAKGTILTSPVLFPMAGGLGQAGEAGAEGVFPLTRTSSGDLGVKGVSPTVHVNVINNANAEVEVRTSQDGSRVDIIVDRAKRAVAADIRSGGGIVASSIESTYALGRARGG